MIDMIIILAVGVSIVGYVLSGYAPDRALKLKIKEIFFIGIAERILFEIRVTNKIPWYLSVVPLPWPFRRIWPSLKWTEIVSGINKRNEKVKGTDHDKFKNVETFDTEPNIFYGLRDELVPSLRIYEPVSYKISVISQNKHTLYLIFTVYIYVEKGMKAVGRPSFKQIGEVDLQTKLGPWALKKTTDDILDTDIDNLKDLKDGIRFEYDGSTIGMEDYLNKKLKPLGCRLYSIALRIIPSKDVQDYFNSGQELAKLNQEKLNQEAQELLREQERITELNDARNQAEIAKTEFNAYAEPIKEMVDSIYENESKLASQRPDVLVEANHQSGTIGVAAINALMSEVDKATNKNAAKQRQEEEANV
jgi:hypothetical protein